MKQDGLHDPKEALNNYFHVNNPPITVPLFVYCANAGFTSLTRSKFLKVLNIAITTARLQPLKGHGIHIRVMLEYLL